MSQHQSSCDCYVPPELWLMILQNLPTIPTVWSLSLADKFFAAGVKSQLLWRFYLKRDFYEKFNQLVKGSPQLEIDWHAEYKSHYLKTLGGLRLALKLPERSSNHLTIEVRNVSDTDAFEIHNHLCFASSTRPKPVFSTPKKPQMIEPFNVYASSCLSLPIDASLPDEAVLVLQPREKRELHFQYKLGERGPSYGIRLDRIDEKLVEEKLTKGRDISRFHAFQARPVVKSRQFIDAQLSWDICVTYLSHSAAGKGYAIGAVRDLRTGKQTFTENEFRGCVRSHPLLITGSTVTSSKRPVHLTT